MTKKFLQFDENLWMSRIFDSVWGNVRGLKWIFPLGNASKVTKKREGEVGANGRFINGARK